MRPLLSLSACQKWTVSLTNNGTAVIPAEKFNDGSYDACGSVSFSVRRMSSTCDNPTTTSGPFVEFCCNDVGNETMVELLTTDESGHTSICMVSALVQDKDIPSISCPPNMTVTCDLTIGSLSVFGSVVEQGLQQPLGISSSDVISASGSLTDGVFFGNCMDTVLESSSQNIDQCGLGSITRKFTARSMSGIESSCNQVITIIHDGNTNKPAITYPTDTSIISCDATDASPDVTGFPIAEEGRCNMIGFSREDQIVTPLDTTILCLKIIRKWTAFETCVNPNKIIGSGEQIIYLEKAQGNNLLVQGTIKSMHGEAVSEVSVSLNTSATTLAKSETRNDGIYAFENMPSGGFYKVKPYKKP